MTDADLREVFHQRFGARPRIARAPGRVNLIGEHTDYNDGWVLPVAIERATSVAFAPAAASSLLVRSAAFPEDEVELALGVSSGKRGHWSDYVAGVLRTLEGRGVQVPGGCLLVVSDVPLGSGLSSSASLLVATTEALLALAAVNMVGEEVALFCQRVENDYVGARCGIMDPFISRLGRAGRAMLLDCRAREASFVSFPESVDLVIVDSGVRHSLADGEYNRRRSECESAVALLARAGLPVTALRDLRPGDLERARSLLPGLEFRRARHVVSENARVLDFADALGQQDLAQAGRLMADSHESLRSDFEVSCEELDLLVRIAAECDGAWGSRMTGGGFGGCTINLVDAAGSADFVRAVSVAYREATGRSPAAWVSRPAAGATVD